MRIWYLINILISVVWMWPACTKSLYRDHFVYANERWRCTGWAHILLLWICTTQSATQFHHCQHKYYIPNMGLHAIWKKNLHVLLLPVLICWFGYCQISNTRHTKSKNFNISRFILQLSLPNPLKLGVGSKLRMQSEQCWQAMLQLHLSDQSFYCLLRSILY